MRKWTRRFLGLALMIVAGCSGPAEDAAQAAGEKASAGTEPELIHNGGFEEPFSNKGVAAQWTDNSSWAPVEVRYADETGEPHAGHHAQKIECTSFKGGAIQFVQYNLPIVKGTNYRVSLWMKGRLDSTVDVQVRKGPAPYTTYLSHMFRIDDRWTQYSFDGVSEDTDPAAMFIIRFGSTGTVWLDDVSCQRSSAPAASLRLTPPATPIPATYFGMHIHRNKPNIQWPAVPFGSLRLWDSRVAWPQLEPERGKWDFSRLDSYLSMAESNHVDVLLPLGLSPTWASARPQEKSAYNSANNTGQTGWAAEPRDLADWDNYVRAVAVHCRGRVHDYEIWNEPDSVPFFSGTVDQLVELTRRASAILKEVDPSNRVVSPAMAGSVMYLDNFLRKGGGKPVDIIGFHFYVRPEPSEKMVPVIQQVKEAMARYGLAGRPIWNTESGWDIEAKLSPAAATYDSHRVVSIKDAGDYVARAYLVNWPAGVERYFFYAYDSDSMGLVEKDGTLKSAAKAYAEIYQWLVGARMDSCQADADGTWIARLSRSGGHGTAVVWNSRKETAFTPPADWHVTQVRDLAGGVRPFKAGEPIQISGSPLLFE